MARIDYWHTELPAKGSRKTAVKLRDEVFDKLAKNNILARKYFYPLTNEFECYQDFETADVSKTPIAKQISDNVLCLPMYADLALEDVDRICKIIKIRPANKSQVVKRKNT